MTGVGVDFARVGCGFRRAAVQGVRVEIFD